MAYHIIPVFRKVCSLLFLTLLFFGWPAKADMPGNTPRSDITVIIGNVQSLGNYVLHIEDYGKDVIVLHDTVYTIYASRGVPHRIFLYATNDSVMTDTLYYDEFQQYNYDLELKGISGTDILYDLKQSPVSKSGNAGSGADAEDISLANIWKTNELLIGVSFVALVGLIIYFVWKKKKKGPGSIDAAL